GYAVQHVIDGEGFVLGKERRRVGNRGLAVGCGFLGGGRTGEYDGRSGKGLDREGLDGQVWAYCTQPRADHAKTHRMLQLHLASGGEPAPYLLSLSAKQNENQREYADNATKEELTGLQYL